MPFWESFGECDAERLKGLRKSEASFTLALEGFGIAAIPHDIVIHDLYLKVHG